MSRAPSRPKPKPKPKPSYTAYTGGFPVEVEKPEAVTSDE